MPRRAIVLRRRDVGRKMGRIVFAGCFSRLGHRFLSGFHRRMVLSENRRPLFGIMRIRHEFHQRAVGIAEIDAGALPLGAEALQRTPLDGDTAALKVLYRIRDRSAPFKTKIAVAGRDRKPRHFRGLDAGAMNVELPVAETIGVADRPGDQLGAEHLGVEGVRALPVGHVDHAMVERYRQHGLQPFCRSSRPRSRSHDRFFSVSRLS